MGARKLSHVDVDRMRALREKGWTLERLGREFGVSRQHAGRLMRGGERTIGGLDASELRASGAVAAVDRYLEDAELHGSDRVLAVVARGVAQKLDDCVASSAATAAQAMPRLAAQLIDAMHSLRGRVHEPDQLDELRLRREARLAARALASGHDQKGSEP